MSKRHIVRTKGKTFCGLSIWHKKEGAIVQASPKTYLPIQTGRYSQATCLTCKKAFEALAKSIWEQGNISELSNLVKNMDKNTTDKESVEQIKTYKRCNT